MIFQNAAIITALALCAPLTQARNLRRSLMSAGRSASVSRDDYQYDHDGKYDYAFYLESKAYDNKYLGYHGDNKRARLHDDKIRFVYHDYLLEEYDDNGKTGKCYEMKDDDYHVELEDCNINDYGQQWLISESPSEDKYGHYYMISNAYYGYVLEYDSSDSTYYLDTRSWKDVDYDNFNYVNKILFQKKYAYKKQGGKACRTTSGGQGSGNGKDYHVYDNTNRDDCRKHCDDDHKCTGWEYSSGRCEKWYTDLKRIDTRDGFDCYVKEY